jgi:hypothetical protein
MRLFVQIITIIFLGYALEQFLPWWAIAVAAFAGGLLVNTNSNFLAGFVGIGLLWTGKALLTDLTTDVELADRVARIFMLNNKVLLLLVTFLISGFVGGFAAMSGGALRNPAPAR